MLRPCIRGKSSPTPEVAAWFFLSYRPRAKPTRSSIACGPPGRRRRGAGSSRLRQERTGTRPVAKGPSRRQHLLLRVRRRRTCAAFSPRRGGSVPLVRSAARPERHFANSFAAARPAIAGVVVGWLLRCPSACEHRRSLRDARDLKQRLVQAEPPNRTLVVTSPRDWRRRLFGKASRRWATMRCSWVTVRARRSPRSRSRANRPSNGRCTGFLAEDTSVPRRGVASIGAPGCTSRDRHLQCDGGAEPSGAESRRSR
ncbi:MAG: hypothetical protein K0S65_1777 [Labilithrix sp.]|nr:hypothetical protein [Labilithrix sp.]